MGAFNTVSTAAPCVVTGIMPLHLEVIRRAAMYWVRKNEEQEAEEVFGVPANTKRALNNIIVNKLQQEWTTSNK